MGISSNHNLAFVFAKNACNLMGKRDEEQEEIFQISNIVNSRHNVIWLMNYKIELINCLLF